MRGCIGGVLLAVAVVSMHAIAATGFQAKDDGKVEGKTVKEWIDVLKTTKDADEGVKAARALGQFGPKAKDAISTLAEVVKEDRKLVADAASDALAGIGPDAIPALRELVKGKNFGAQVKALRGLASVRSKESGVKDMVTLYTDLLKNEPDAEVRTAVVYFGVANVDSEAKKKAVPALAAGLKDKNGEVVIACAFVLGTMRKDAKSVVPDLVAVVKDKKRDEDVRETCLIALSNIGPDAKEAVKDLVAIAQKDESKYVRGQALSALVSIDIEAAKKLGFKPPEPKKKD